MKVYNNTPNITSFKGALTLGKKSQEALMKADDFTSVHQRIATGAFALGIQPAMDFMNKDVDKDTRQVSAARSAAKAIIGTCTGIAIRAGCIAAIDKAFSKVDETGKKALDLDKIRNTFKGLKDAPESALRRAPANIGTMAALGVMLFTNFLIDMPLTNITMNKINEFAEKKKAKDESQGAIDGK